MAIGRGTAIASEHDGITTAAGAFAHGTGPDRRPARAVVSADGALDLGLVLLQEPTPERYERFVAEHVAAPLRAAALVLRLAVGEAVPAPALTPFETIQVETEAFVGALADLSGFQSLPEARLREAVDGLSASFRRLRDAALDVAERLGFEPTIGAPVGSTGAAGEGDVYEAILNRLHEDLLAEKKDRGG